LTRTIKLGAALAIAALASPAAAASPPSGQGPPDHAGPPAGPPGLTAGDSQDISGGGEGSPVTAGSKGKCPTVGYVFRGTYTDTAVTVEAGNRHVRKAEFVGTDVEFDLTNAKLVVGDTNGDGVTDVGDVEAGDRVLVTAKLAKCDPGDGPYAAKQFVDQTNPPLDEVDDAD